ncbi:hypothetical protein ABKN59_009487 [Abortiporus biennis]
MPAYRTRNSHSRSLSLDLTTDAPITPTVAIVSPTPRAFVFPVNHEIPYASRSTSPYSVIHKSIQTPPPLRTPTPSSVSESLDSSETSSIFSTPSAMSSQASHRRRRSVVGENERRPKKGDEDYIKRPENAFILFRRKCCEDRQAAAEEGSDDAPTKKQRQADLSKTISQQWKSLPAEERSYWEDLAKEKKKEHEQMYPNYVYRPQRVKDKSKKKGKGKKYDGELETDSETLSFVVPVVPSPPHSPGRATFHSQGRRAASAPTPPPAYQTIQLPSVYMPSCPASPSLVPRISRRTPLPTHPIPPPTDADPSTHFEYMPNGSLLPPYHRHSFDATPTNDSFQIYRFSGQHSERRQSLHSLTIPPEPSMYTSSNVMSPAESIASSFLSPAESIASSISPASPPNGPYTPSDNLALSGLSIGHHGEQYINDNCDDLESQRMGYGGYAWQGPAIWPDNTETMLPDDFVLDAIPPVELGLSALDQGIPQNCGDMEGSSPYVGMMEENEFNEHNPGGHDPFASLFAYDNSTMNW